MDEHKHERETSEPELNHPEAAIEDLEVEEQDTEGVKGGVPAVQAQFQEFTVTKTTDASTPKLN